MKVTASKGRLIVLGSGICGLGVLCLSSLFLGFFDEIVHFFVKRELILQPGNEFYDIWKEIPLPIYQKIFIFNITNPVEFTQGEKPVLQELGPYVFRGRWMKEVIKIDEENGTVTYKDIKEYTFVPEMSFGDQEEKVYTLNGPLLAVINYMEKYSLPFIRSFITPLVNGMFDSYNETLLIHRTVRELVYEGYHEPMVADLTKIVENFITLPLKLVNDTFGILHERKHVGDGVFTIKSGYHGIEDYTSIQTWNNRSVVNWWNDEKCNRIRGTDGVQYAPGVTRNTSLSLFNPNLCRVIPIQYERDITVHGIKTLRFGIPTTAFASADVNPDNVCYCHGKNCHSGILPLNCKKGAPYVISLPHFLDGDEQLKSAIHGVKPSPEKHKTYLDIEPTTGFVLNAAFRIQLNGVTRKLPGYKQLENVSETIVPVLWMSEEAQLDAFFANYFKSRVQTPLVMFKLVCLTGVAIGIFWAVASVVILLCIQAKVKPENIKQSFVLKTLNSVYTSVAVWPPPEEDIKNINVNEKTHL